MIHKPLNITDPIPRIIRKRDGSLIFNKFLLNSNVQGFILASDFFTLDVAGKIGTRSSDEEIAAFITSCNKYFGVLSIPGILDPFEIPDQLISVIAEKFLAAIAEAGKIYSLIKDQKGAGHFVTEVSMDEVEVPQTPVELFFILKMIADQGIPVQTIAPKFTGRFNYKNHKRFETINRYPFGI